MNDDQVKKNAEAVSQTAEWLATVLSDCNGVLTVEHPKKRDKDYSAYVIFNTAGGGKYQLKVTAWAIEESK